MSGAPPIPDPCYKCRHFTGIYVVKMIGGMDPDAEPACKAFPRGIPADIQEGQNGHDKPLPGQKNKLVFDPDPRFDD